MPSRRDEWYRGGHPPACTCVSCNTRRLGISSSGGRGGGGRRTTVGATVWSNVPKGDEGGSWFKHLLVASVVVVAIALISSFVIHSIQGATPSVAAAMVLDDVKLVATCPTEIGNVADFVLRPDSTPITPLLNKEASSNFLRAICNGDLAIAQSIIKDSGRASLAQAPNLSPTSAPVFISSGTSTPRPLRTISVSPTLIPRTLVVTASPPECTPIPTVGVVILTSTSAPTQVASRPTGIFESLEDLEVSNSANQPEIDLQVLVERIHILINIERTRHGIAALTLDSKISAIARNHSSDMARNDYFEHDNLHGLSPTDRGAAVDYDCIKTHVGYYTFGLAENIFQTWLYSSTTYINGFPVREWNSQEELATQTVQEWMDSRGHRENILTDTYDRAGLGIAVSQDGKVYVTQDFC